MKQACRQAAALQVSIRRGAEPAHAAGQLRLPTKTSFRPRRTLLSSLLGLLALALVSGCAPRAPAPAGPVLRVSQRNEPATLDPQLASLPDEFLVLRALLEGLVTPAPDGGPPLPGVAERWETSADGLTWTFHLRRQARWSNGDPVTAGDFVYTFRRALNPALGAPKARLFYALKNARALHSGQAAATAPLGAAAPDQHTLVLTLEQPAPHLLTLAASGPWLPVHAVTVEIHGNTRESRWALPGNFVGNGPFVLTTWEPNRQLEVTRNPVYRDPARVPLAALRFLAFDSGDTEERAFRTGQVDVTMSVPVTKLTSYTPPILHTQPLAETRYLSFNTTRPPLNDPQVRRALALAIDRSALTGQVLRGGQQSAYSLIPPGLGAYPASPQFSSDPTEARRLLAAAGFPGGQGFPTLEIATWTNPVVLEAIQQMWRRELGIGTTILQHEAKVHLAALAAGDYTVAFVPAIPDYDDPAALLGEFTTGAALNYPHWSNPGFDTLLASADRIGNAGGRHALLREAEKILMAEMPLVPLYFNTRTYLVAPRVRGWREDRLWNRFYTDVTLHE